MVSVKANVNHPPSSYIPVGLEKCSHICVGWRKEAGYWYSDLIDGLTATVWDSIQAEPVQLWIRPVSASAVWVPKVLVPVPAGSL